MTEKTRTLFGIGYCRISRDEQKEGTSLEDQEKEIRDYAKENGIILLDTLQETYTGTVYRERKVLTSMRERYRKGEANCVIVRTFDRLARNEVHFAVLLDEMEHYEVELHCVKEKLDDSIMGRLARNIIAAFAEFEHGKIIERTNTGKRNRILLKQEFIPGSKPPYGFDWNNPAPKEKTALIVKRQEASTALRIHRLYDEGASVSTIVRTLIEEGVPPPASTWNRRTVLRILRDERYTGHGMAFTKHKRNAKYPLEPVPIPEGTIPAIVPVELFQRNQRRLDISKQESSRRNRAPSEFLLRAGFLKCGECGHVMRTNRKWNEENQTAHSHVYYCHSRYEIPPTNCPGQAVSAKRIDELAWKVLEEVADEGNLATIEKGIKIAMEETSIDADVEAIDNSIANAQEQVRQYQEDLKDTRLRGTARSLIIGDLAHAQEQLENLQHEKAMLQAGEIDMQRIRAELQKVLDWCQTVRENRGNLSYESKRTFMRVLGVEVVLRKTDKRTEPIDYDVNFTIPEIVDLIAPHRAQTRNGSAFIERQTPWDALE